MAPDDGLITTAKRFRAVWNRCGTSDAEIETDAVYQMLRAHYAAPGRYYHTLAHLHHCLHEFDAIGLRDAGTDAIELSLWFHDLIYVPGAMDNELRSAACFARHARGTLPDALVALVERLILATTHRGPPHDSIEAWVIDIDLSSFGLPWPAFLRDSRHVREEQRSVEDALYYAMQSRFLHSLCERTQIFTTDHFRARYEAQARANIARLLEAIAAGSTLEGL